MTAYNVYTFSPLYGPALFHMEQGQGFRVQESGSGIGSRVTRTRPALSWSAHRASWIKVRESRFRLQVSVSNLTGPRPLIWSHRKGNSRRLLASGFVVRSLEKYSAQPLALLATRHGGCWCFLWVYAIYISLHRKKLDEIPRPLLVYRETNQLRYQQKWKN